MSHQAAVPKSTLEDRLRFEETLAEISSRFVNLPPNEVSGEIEYAQRRVCECLGLDLSSLWLWSAEAPFDLTLAHLYRPLGGPPIPETMDARSFFPWSQRQFLEGSIVPVESMEELPPEAARDREVWEHFGVKTSLGIPLMVGGERPMGVVSFNTMLEERSWPEEMVQRLRLVAQVFANALMRKRSDAALSESEKRLQLAADSGEIGMWQLDAESGRFWTTGRARGIFGYQPEIDISIDRVLETVHPDDRELVEEAIRGAIEDDQELDIEYRIVRGDGEERWIRSRGRKEQASATSPVRLIGASVDVTERKRSEEKQVDQLRFESLLSDLSRSVLGAPADEIDGAIGDAHRRVCEYLDIELSALWQWSPDNPVSQVLAHLYRPVGGPTIPDQMDARKHFPWSLDQMLAGKIVALSSIDDAPPEAAKSKESWRRLGVRSTLILPLAAGGETAIGSLSFNALSSERQWTDEEVQRLRLVAEIFSNALKRKHSEERLRGSLTEIERLKNRLEVENTYLRKEHRLRHGQGLIVGESPAVMEVLGLVEQVAGAQTTVLIEGETGTGKELVAQRIHELSPRKERPMVRVNCAALPSTLVESELFGREKGAYTGAVSNEQGRFEVADGSTILLDEVAELPLELQPKLLRVLEQGTFERVGRARELKTDVRVIAATNRDLRAEVEAGRFRSDLYFRLAVFPIRVPPLRARRGDVPLLVWSFVHELAAAMNKPVESIPFADMEHLQRHDWPGNVRELRNVVERAMILCEGPTLRIEPPEGADIGSRDDGTVLPMDEAQSRHIMKALEAAGGKVRGAGGAAELLGMNPSTLRSRMRRLGLDPRRFKSEI